MSSTERSYDYIIAGGGCAGLSLAVRMASSEALRSKKILLIEREAKNKNDRTWCYWEKEAGFFEPIVHKSWDALDFKSADLSRRLAISPYRYKMIRSADFYRYCDEILSRSSQVDRMQASVNSFRSEGDGVVLMADTSYRAKHLFNSTLSGISFESKPWISLRQHFRGWTIRTQDPVFNSSVATLMDFRVPQDHGTAFFYTLPLSANRALVEYTLFTKDMLAPEEYTHSLEKYIQEYITKTPYTIEEQEDGVIPMTNYPFAARNGNIMNIGTAGGHTKASTGYTFQFIQKGTERIVSSLSADGHLPNKTGPARFSLYDATMLRVLQKKQANGADLFTRIFRRGDPISVLRFLDNESSFWEELAIMNRMPKAEFVGAALMELWSKYSSRRSALIKTHAD